MARSIADAAVRLMGGALAAMMTDPVGQVLLWVLLAFCLWLVLMELGRKLAVPDVGVAAAMLSWLVARLCLWGVPTVLHRVGPWVHR